MNFKVGDKVYAEAFGYGVVMDVEAQSDFPLRVKFESSAGDITTGFYADGAYQYHRTGAQYAVYNIRKLSKLELAVK